MKKILRIVLIITLIAATLLLSSCGMEKYSYDGFVFRLPRDMRQLNVTYADFCYGNGECEFFVYSYTRDAILVELFLDKDAKCSEYLDKFIAYNGYTGVDKSVDDENNTATAKYIYEPENDFYYDYVLRNHDVLIHVTMTCSADLREKYEPAFDEWIEYIYLED